MRFVEATWIAATVVVTFLAVFVVLHGAPSPDRSFTVWTILLLEAVFLVGTWVVAQEQADRLTSGARRSQVGCS